MKDRWSGRAKPFVPLEWASKQVCMLVQHDKARVLLCLEWYNSMPLDVHRCTQ